MIKGVNKKIIEVSKPDSVYFEKAVFYLKPEVSFFPDEKISDEIESFQQSRFFSPGRRKSHKKTTYIFFISVLLICFLGGVFVGVFGNIV